MNTKYKKYKRDLDTENKRHAYAIACLDALRIQIESECKHKHTTYCFNGPYTDPYTICDDCGKIF